MTSSVDSIVVLDQHEEEENEEMDQEQDEESEQDENQLDEIQKDMFPTAMNGPPKSFSSKMNIKEWCEEFRLYLEGFFVL